MNHIQLRSVTALACATLAVSSAACNRAAPVKPDLVASWVRTWYGATRVERLSPPVASRAIAYAATALYVGMASVDTTMPALDATLQGVPRQPRTTRPSDHDATIAAVAAERVVLDSMWTEALPTTWAAFARLADSLVADRVAQGVSDHVRARSDSLGTSVHQTGPADWRARIAAARTQQPA